MGADDLQYVEVADPIILGRAYVGFEHTLAECSNVCGVWINLCTI